MPTQSDDEPPNPTPSAAMTDLTEAALADDPPPVAHARAPLADRCIVRPAEARDIGPAWSVEQSAFTESDRFSLRQTAGLIVNPRARVFVAEHDGDIVAWIAMLTRDNRARRDAPPVRTGRLYTIAVSPDWAGRGLGRRMAAHAIGALDAEGLVQITLEVREENHRAIALYRSMGFVIRKRLPTYYGEASPGLRMVRERPI